MRYDAGIPGPGRYKRAVGQPCGGGDQISTPISLWASVSFTTVPGEARALGLADGSFSTVSGQPPPARDTLELSFVPRPLPR